MAGVQGPILPMILCYFNAWPSVRMRMMQQQQERRMRQQEILLLQLLPLWNQNCQSFLAMMDELRSAIIQDPAVMLLDLPDCAQHGLFQLPVFQSQASTEYMNGMKHHLEQSQAPYNTWIDQVLPGVHSRMDSMGGNLSFVREKVDKHESQMKLIPSTIHEVLHFFGNDAMKAVAMSSKYIGRLRTQTSPLATVSPWAPPPAQPAQPTAEPICAAPGYGYRLPAKPQSATNLWHAWHRTGPYENKPVQGGIPVMETDHIGWRKMYTKNK